MKNLNRVISTIIYIFSIVVFVVSADESFFDINVNSEEIIDPHSFYYDRRTKTMIKETDLQTTESEQFENKEPEKYGKTISTDNCNTHEGIFYKRLINLLLSSIDIKTQGDEVIVGTLNIEASHSQLETLRNFHIGKTSLREIDTILSDIIKKPEHNYIDNMMYFKEVFIDAVNNAFTIIKEYRDVIVIMFAMLIIFFATTKLMRGRGSIFSIIQILFIMSFFMTWWQLIQEAEIKLTATQMQFSEIPITCQPHKMNLWHKFVATVFSDNDCEKYYEAVMSNPKLQVTPAFALSHFISTVILHPIANVGSIISSFIHNATDDLPWTYGWIVKLILFLSVGLGIIVLPFCLCGASVNVGLGPLFKFGIDCRKKNKKGNSLPNIENREPVQIILQLPQNTGAPVITNVPESCETKVMQALTNINSEKDVTQSKNDFTRDCDKCLSGGDTVSSTDSLKSDDVQNATYNSIKGEDGSGDG